MLYPSSIASSSLFCGCLNIFEIRIAQNTRVLCILEARSSSLVFNSQNTENLEKFLDFLCKELHRREIAYQNTVHNGLQYDFREFSSKKSSTQQQESKQDYPRGNGGRSGKSSSSGSSSSGPRKRCEGCNNAPDQQKGDKCVLETRHCIFSAHPDHNKSGLWNKFWKAKKYREIGQFWIRPYKKLAADGKKMEDMAPQANQK